MDDKYIYHNIPQIKMQLVDAQIMVAIMARATGKTHFGGFWTSDRMNRMARSGNAIAGSTYTHLLTKLAPGIISAWQALGYEMDKHFWFNKYPPKAYRIPNAHKPVLSPKYTVFWWNGSFTQFLSAENGLNNGLSADSIYFDEARFLPPDKVREITLTARGNFSHFGHLSCHNSLLFTSDRPRSAKSQWLNEMQKEMDTGMIDAIMKASVRLNQLKLEYTAASNRKREAIKPKMRYYEEWLNQARKGQVYYIEASTLDNVHALGLQAIKNFRRVLSPSDFNISVLNLKPGASPNSFYPLLNEEVHGFHSENVGYIEALDIDLKQGVTKDCRWKSPRHYDMGAPLDIAMDYNFAINSLSVGQGDRYSYRLLNSLFVLSTDRLYLADVVKKFCDFYKYHRNKVVNYYFDNTAISMNASGRISFKDEVVQELRKEGWQVVEHRITQASTHEHRFTFWQKLLGGKDDRLPAFGYDIDDAHLWQVSAENAGVKQSESGFKKDKSTETRKDRDGNYYVRPEDSTHISEATDCLMDGKFGRLLMTSTSSSDNADYMI
jgi:hypothetical protein